MRGAGARRARRRRPALAAGCRAGARARETPSRRRPRRWARATSWARRRAGSGRRWTCWPPTRSWRPSTAALLRRTPPAGRRRPWGSPRWSTTRRAAALAPTFIAVLDTGAVVPLVPAAEALGARQDAAARRRPLMPADRSAPAPAGRAPWSTWCCAGVVPGRVAEVRMTTGRGTPIAARSTSSVGVRDPTANSRPACPPTSTPSPSA